VVFVRRKDNKFKSTGTEIILLMTRGIEIRILASATVTKRVVRGRAESDKNVFHVLQSEPALVINGFESGLRKSGVLLGTM
jgi:hypothetical protein